MNDMEITPVDRALNAVRSVQALLSSKSDRAALKAAVAEMFEADRVFIEWLKQRKEMKKNVRI